MPTYTLHAINVGSFPLGESDKVLTLFSAERGIVRAVAKGARKPGSKIGGRADLLNLNRLLMATGRSLEIISQAETIETFPRLRDDLTRLSFALYYAELTSHFGLGLSLESDAYLDFLCQSLKEQAGGEQDAAVLCLQFELKLLEWLGYQPELDCCVQCRDPLSDYRIEVFNFELGGIVCDQCMRKERQQYVKERQAGRPKPGSLQSNEVVQVTPLVWKRLILASHGSGSAQVAPENSPALLSSNQAARRIVQGYIEYRAGKRMKALDLIGKL